MTYVIEASSFGIGYSIFRMEMVDGQRIKRYIADVPTVAEGKILCVNAVEIICPSEVKYRSQLSAVGA